MKTPVSAIALLFAFALFGAGPAQAQAPTTDVAPVLSVRISGDGAGSVTSHPSGIDCRDQCSARFAAAAADTTVTLTATADSPGSVFIGWAGACDSIAPTCTVTLDGAKSVEALVADIGDTVQAVSAGYHHTCALTSAGAVWCWGGNENGQIGDGTTTQRLLPVQVSSLPSGVKAISAGDFHSCAVSGTGAAWCWGYNGAGQLGDGTVTQRLTPVAVSGLAGSVQAVSAGFAHTCALTDAGTAWCWGNNFEGELGDGTTTARLTPVPVSGLLSSVVQTISASNTNTCASSSAGAAWCWGRNDSGQLGDGTMTDRLSPVAVSGLSSGVRAITSGQRHACAVTTAGAVWCWGRNEYGQLGDNTTISRLTPVVASNLSGAQTVSAGRDHTCASTSAGAAWCWGLNTYGQLGINGTITLRSIPTVVAGLSGVTGIDLGNLHSCAWTSAGAAWCWGSNSDGQVGDGTTTQRLAPVLVIEPPNLIFRNDFE